MIMSSVRRMAALDSAQTSTRQQNNRQESNQIEMSRGEMLRPRELHAEHCARASQTSDRDAHSEIAGKWDVAVSCFAREMNHRARSNSD
ncbi:autophagy regulatory protein Atg2, putative [Pseudozyma hubeiensis SY62]|uniref:Autophagy regulatory protein Atg2, putative n=1 Tax=Pseudozyma hubeiensis (strain SY62) TaxID=1305764 RepID=R9P9X6_PSEHS|nr:autophagy regulatory protein Atg2, putative [Pseudozyma hubeiensis SY62]GAC98057.1 autophagy regulatory protein Atg2, putative [Pseudozyma hubeiensis SY62]